MERHINQPDEADFRDRANKFVTEIAALTNKYLDVISADFENTTQSIIDTSPKSAQLFRDAGMKDEARQILNEGHEADSESAFQNIVNISVWSGSVNKLTDFLKEAEKIARRLGGEKEPGNLFTDRGEDVIENRRFEVDRSFKFS